jgi:hypothetical protein
MLSCFNSPDPALPSVYPRAQRSHALWHFPTLIMALSSYVMAGGLLLMLATAWQAMQCELHLYRGGDVRPSASCPCSIADDVLTPPR